MLFVMARTWLPWFLNYLYSLIDFMTDHMTKHACIRYVHSLRDTVRVCKTVVVSIIIMHGSFIGHIPITIIVQIKSICNDIWSNLIIDDLLAIVFNECYTES